MVLFFVLWVHAELECCLRAFPQKWTFSSGPRVSPVLLCCVTLTPLEYLHSIQPQSFPWGPTPQPEPPHPAPTCCRQMRVCELLFGWKLQFGTTSVQNFLCFALLCFHLRFLSSPITLLVRGVLVAWKLLLLQDPLLRMDSQDPLSPFLSYLIPSRLACLSGLLGPLLGFRRCAMGIVPHTGYLLIYL